MQNSPELLKSFAEKIAQLAETDDCTKAMQLLCRSGLLGIKPNQPAVDSTPSTSEADHVGIWERKKGTGHFVRRPELMQEWHLWANIGKIEPRQQGKLRVVLIGESVARGYLYDPQFTPAMALEAILQAQLGHNAVEVIDLARTDLSFGARQLAKSALLLEPDVVIVFAGNNWDASFSGDADLPLLYESLRTHGVAGWKTFFKDKLSGMVQDMVHDIAATYAAQNVPLLWIVPEFNLAGWVDESGYVPRMESPKVAEWVAHYEKAQCALSAGDYQTARDSAGKMKDLDSGVSRAPWYLLAECSKRQGNMDEARTCLEEARDTHVLDRELVSPRCFSASQNILRSELRENLVDLPKLFREYLNGGIPDRRLFLDYCHLNTEGIQVAMAAAASHVLRVVKQQEIPWRQLLHPRVAPTDRVEAEARFLAAIHCAHCRQPYEIVLYHCLCSVQLSREVAEVMACFADFQSRRTPMLMCQSAEQLAGLGLPLTQHYLFHVNQQQLDRNLLEAIAAALKTIGTDISEQLQRVRREEQQAAGGKTNLLDFYYCSSAAKPLDSMWVLPVQQQITASDYYRAHWPSSDFVFVAKGRRCCLTRIDLPITG